MAESFFATLKAELVYRRTWPTRHELEMEIFSCIEGFYIAMIESFWSRMQVELLNRKRWRTRLELANATFEYLEIWHNRRRRPSALGWLSPIEFENENKIVVA